VTGLPRLTARARLTLLHTGLFALCGGIVVAVSYLLVAQLGLQQSFDALPAPAQDTLVAQCQSQQRGTPEDKILLTQCIASIQQQAAQAQRDLTLSHLLQYSLIALAVVIALAALLGWIFSGRALQPVHRITVAARAASERNLSARVALRGPRDELRELADTFDEMLGRLQAAFESQQRFIANASHELRTPLAVVRTTVDVVLGNPDSTPDELRGMAADIRVEVDHAERLIGALLILARNDRGLTVHDEVDMATVGEDVLDSADLRDRRVHAALDPAVISGDPMLAERLVANLVDNAVRYNIDEGDIWISTHTAAGACQSDRGQHRPAYQLGRCRTHLRAVPAAYRSDVPGWIWAWPCHRQVHRRNSRWDRPRVTQGRWRPVDHRHVPLCCGERAGSSD